MCVHTGRKIKFKTAAATAYDFAKETNNFFVNCKNVYTPNDLSCTISYYPINVPVMID